MTKIRQLLSRGGMLRNVNSFYRFAVAPFRMSPGQFHETFTVFYAKVLSLFQVCTVATDLEHSQQTSVLFKDGDVPFLSDFSGKCVERSRRKF